MTIGQLVWLIIVGSAVAAAQELGLVHMRLEGIKDKCIVEDLPEKTVALIKHEGVAWNSVSGMKADNAAFQLLITVKVRPLAVWLLDAQDPSGHTVTRQQSKPSGRVFLTAASTGEHLICFQLMLTQYTPNVYTKLYMEVYLGDAGDPNIVAPINAKLNDLSYHIAKSNELVADVQREQALQRDRETNFRNLSERVNGRTVVWPLVQAVVILLTATFQMYHLRRFFRAKKLV